MHGVLCSDQEFKVILGYLETLLDCMRPYLQKKVTEETALWIRIFATLQKA